MKKRRINLKVLDLINNNSNWKDILTSNPYNIIIKEKGDFILLKYNQINSDMSNQIVQECRGLILKRKYNKYKVASIRFNKFFNYGQEEAATLEFPAEVSEKIDGSLIGVWYDENSGWHVSTSGNIDAEDAPIGINGISNYKELFNTVWDNCNFDFLNKDCTYIFELVSPYTRIIVPYHETKLYLLAIKNNITLEEFDRKYIPFIAEKLFNGKIETPKSYICNNIEEVKNSANALTENNDNFEGFVICDDNFNRVKLKSPVYTNLFFIKGEGIFTDKKILRLILDEQDDDILGYFPEYTSAFNNVRKNLSLFIESLKKSLRESYNYRNRNKKEYALWAKEYKYSDILFKAYGINYWEMNEDDKAMFIKNYIENIPIQKLSNVIKGDD